MLTYFPAPPFADGLCGVAYSLSPSGAGAGMRLPALMAQVQVCLAGTIAMQFGDGPLVAAPPLSIVGPTHGASEARLTPNARVVGVGLLARGWRDAVGDSAHAFADQRIDAAAVWGDGPARRLVTEMAGLPDAAAATRLFEFITVQATAGQGRRGAEVGSDWRLQVVDDWLAETAAAPVDALVARLGFSRRQVERLTARHYGASPKLLELKYKTLALAASAALRKVDLAEPFEGEARDVFYDQSHQIRNFRRFVGWTPSQFQREHAEFARGMLIGRWQAGARSAMTLWS